jgi:single-strand DNA-binding protein
MNLVVIHGNLGAAPEVRRTASDLAVANLSVATNERVKTNGEWQDHTEWHRVTVFGSQAELCQKYLAKGSKVVITGKLRTRQFTDKTGVEKYSTEILADRVEFGSNARPAEAGSSPPPMQSNNSQPFQDDEIPF